MSDPLVSVCLPNLNTFPFLRERMESLLYQTLPDWEIVISDNFSDDGSWELLREYGEDKRVRMFQSERQGMYANWNNCLRQARGEYIYIATSDDSACATMLSKMSSVLEKYRDVDLAVCAYDDTDVDGNILTQYEEEEIRFLRPWLNKLHRRNGKAEFLVNMCLGCHWKTLTALLFRRSLLEKTGLFRTDCLSYADVPWRIKAILNSDLIYIPQSLATWRQHESQATAKLPANRERLVYESIKETVKECDGLIPGDWKRDSDYAGRILFQRRRRYLMEYHLHRGAVRRNPGSFLKGIACAAVKEPFYLLERLATGFSWNTRWHGDRTDYLNSLMQRWNIEWPPTILE